MTDAQMVRLLRLGAWGGADDDFMEIAGDRIEQLNRLLDEMSLLLRLADFEDLGDYHASLDVLSKYKEISNV